MSVGGLLVLAICPCVCTLWHHFFYWVSVGSCCYTLCVFETPCVVVWDSSELSFLQPVSLFVSCGPCVPLCLWEEEKIVRKPHCCCRQLDSQPSNVCPCEWLGQELPLKRKPRGSSDPKEWLLGYPPLSSLDTRCPQSRSGLSSGSLCGPRLPLERTLGRSMPASVSSMPPVPSNERD